MFLQNRLAHPKHPESKVPTKALQYSTEPCMYYYLWGFPKLSSNVKRIFFRNLYFFVLPEHYGIHAIPGTLNSGKFIRSDKFDYRVEQL